MTGNELRRKYIEFFKSKDHAEIPSASLIPENDPTVLFTTAGMHPLVPYLLGEPHPSGRRLVDYQRCVRTGDIEDVGDDTHCTFFTMLGNWSLQDYFKKESIEWSFEFLTSKEWLGIPLEKLSVTVFEGNEATPFDEESYNHWIRLGMPAERIAKLGAEDNWWGPAGKTGPCGPDTEIFYWVGEGEPTGNKGTHPKEWMEIWNNVFMQFNKQEDGTLVPLEKGSVDTGMGLERTIVALQGKTTVYETELFVPILNEIERVLQISIENGEQKKSARIIADHLRTASMLAMDGVVPGNKDQGYIMRRLIRRTLRHMRKWNESLVPSEAIPKVLTVIGETLADSYPTLLAQAESVTMVILQEAEKFAKTLDKGERELKKLIEKTGTLSGTDAFNLYQSFGFPLELTQEMIKDAGLSVDHETFKAEFQKHQDLSRQGAEKKFAGGLADHSEDTVKLHTATHLLHQALRTVLGDHVEQKGSNITAERLRFDFSHPEKMTPEQIAETERLVNDAIAKALPVHFELLDVEEAKTRGAIGLFGDKYAQIGGKIKVYFMGDGPMCFSKEICGGPHVNNTADLKSFKIQKEEASSAGVRRIKAVVGA